jgi:predicted TIM-barrel fold metal-dependent hydrolase
MRNGYKVFDADTHFHPLVETIEPYLDAALRARAKEFKRREFKTGWAGEPMSEPYRHLYQFREAAGWGSSPPRHLGEPGPRPNEGRHFQHFMGEVIPTEGGADFDLAARIADMDREGQDVHMMVPGVATGHEDVSVDVGMLQALHRYLDDVCGRYPDRLKSMVIANARFIDESVAEIKRWAGSPWVCGVLVSLPIDYPIDHPDMDPIWAAADDAGLCVIHHSFAAGYPGYRDLWDNPFIGRTASHPWAAMRMVSAFMGAGIMDRFPNIRLSILESGFGWLPFWTKRMEDQVVYMGYVKEDLQHTMTEYMTGGRFFACIVLHEGEDMVRVVSDLMGDHMLMFGSDYPHAESRFPNSVDMVLGWESLGADRMRKLLWDNAARCFGLG